MELISDFIIRQNGDDMLIKKRIKLLKEIEKTGSILKAAKEIPMSYKSAWDAIDAINNLSPKPVLDRQAGGRKGGGSKLTKYGKSLVNMYEKIEKIQSEFLKFISKNTDINLGEISNLERIAMQISARNVFLGKVLSIKNDAVNSNVVVELNGGAKISSTITTTSAKNLELKEDLEVKAIIKSSSVMIAKDENITISARNIIKGEIVEISKGEVNAEVRLNIGKNQILTSVITLNSVERLGLKVGEIAFGVIKSSEIMIGL
ncbi:TOBE domain-containing protein [Campylobacter corcagiensis]|uniref:TOBE domain-containing protein n=1 Tax=Campylobacter corcagiensis TaxID=1448857 RepID=A0A7M1LHF8_9BACT|nr:TOBE domain-containing protein [Campylobacter corcagiensis]QKF65395.1 transcriptional regulator, ModE family [Campylobacter corcagiensis]QOQ88029.1 TOBE domain-containing protein [Campylobacter corcagiensis]